MDNRVVLESSPNRVNSTKEIGRRKNVLAMVFSNISLRSEVLRENGNRTNPMDVVSTFGEPIFHYHNKKDMKVNFQMGEGTEWEIMLGQLVIDMRDSGKKDVRMVLALTSGKLVQNMKERGKKTKNMVLEASCGPMGTNLRENGKMGYR